MECHLIPTRPRARLFAWPNKSIRMPTRPMKPLQSCVGWLRRRCWSTLARLLECHGTYTRLDPKPTHHALTIRHHRLIPLRNRPLSPTAQEASKCGRRRRAPTTSPRRRRRRALLRRRLERPRRPRPLLQQQAETHRSRSQRSSPSRCRTLRSAACPGT